MAQKKGSQETVSVVIAEKRVSHMLDGIITQAGVGLTMDDLPMGKTRVSVNSSAMNHDTSQMGKNTIIMTRSQLIAALRLAGFTPVEDEPSRELN